MEGRSRVCRRVTRAVPPPPRRAGGASPPCEPRSPKEGPAPSARCVVRRAVGHRDHRQGADQGRIGAGRRAGQADDGRRGFDARVRVRDHDIDRARTRPSDPDHENRRGLGGRSLDNFELWRRATTIFGVAEGCASIPSESSRFIRGRFPRGGDPKRCRRKLRNDIFLTEIARDACDGSVLIGTIASLYEERCELKYDFTTI